MSFKKNVAKFASISLAAAMTLSLVGCSNPFKKMTAEDVLTKVEENQIVSIDSIQKLFEEDEITSKDVKKLLKNVPSMEMEMGVDFAGKLSGDDGDEEHNIDGSVNGKVNINYDSKTQSLSLLMGGEYDVDLDGIEQNAKVKDGEFGIYLVNEDDTYYMYQKTPGQKKAVRTELGEFDELFEDISVQDILDEAGVENADELFASVTEKSIKDYKDDFTLAKDKVEKNGEKCYVLTYTANGKKIIEALEDNDDFIESLEEQDMDFDEFLETEVADSDVTIEDVLKKIELDITIYVTDKTFYVTYIEIDMSKCLNNLIDEFVDDIAESINDDMELEIKVEKCSFYYSIKYNTDTTVEYTGKYEDIEDTYIYDYDYDWDEDWN